MLLRLLVYPAFQTKDSSQIVDCHETMILSALLLTRAMLSLLILSNKDGILADVINCNYLMLKMIHFLLTKKKT